MISKVMITYIETTLGKSLRSTTETWLGGWHREAGGTRPVEPAIPASCIPRERGRPRHLNHFSVQTVLSSQGRALCVAGRCTESLCDRRCALLIGTLSSPSLGSRSFIPDFWEVVCLPSFTWM